jgi:hypothetical protein
MIKKNSFGSKYVNDPTSNISNISASSRGAIMLEEQALIY